MKILTELRSKKYPLGSVHATNDFGPLEIVGRYDEPKCDLYRVRFLSTGYETKARTSSIVKGMVKDPYVPTVFGRGYLGSGKYTSKINGKTTREYKLWTGMFYRCYSKDPQYTNYRLRDIQVCRRWNDFQLFCEDIQDLEGYLAWKSGFNMALDKDLRFNGTYSPDSCMFISKAENSRESALRQHSNKK